MRLTLYFTSGDVLRLDYVQSVRLVGPNAVKIATFGNVPVVHRHVSRVESAFVFSMQVPQEVR